MINTVALVGRLTRDPELRYVGTNNTALCTFGVAVNEKVGEKEVTKFFDCKSWKSAAEGAATLRKGDSVMVVGKLDQESWDDKQTGQKRSKIVILATAVGKPLFKKESSSQAAPAPAASPAAPPADDDVPF